MQTRIVATAVAALLSAAAPAAALTCPPFLIQP